MKTKIFTLIALVLGFTFAACTDQDYEETSKGDNELALTLSQGTQVLQETNHASDAVTMSWTTGSNYGSGSRIYYKLELAPAGSSFAAPYVAVDSAVQVYTWSANEENLNNLILDKFGGQSGQPVTLEARVSAYAEGAAVQQATQTFTVTPYEPVTTTLYIIGSATQTGWSADNAEALTRTDNGHFTWEGYLNPGTFKFITTRGQFLPSYNRDGSDDRLVLRSSDSQPDDQWAISERHYYKMQLNLLDSTIVMTEAEGAKPAYDQLFFIGGMTSWNFVEMTRDALDPFLFRYGRMFTEGGEFKFGTAQGSWENMYKATVDNAAYTDQRMSLVKGFDPDHKWYLNNDEAGKAYKICVDIRTGAERMMMREFTPYPGIWLVGDATPNGWDLGNATAMQATDSPYIFTWTGQLNAGEMKFSCDKQSDWNGAWFLCGNGNDVAPTGTTEPMLFVDKSSDDFKAQYLDTDIGGVDHKWKITQSGTYTITLNQLEETVTIVKQ